MKHFTPGRMPYQLIQEKELLVVNNLFPMRKIIMEAVVETENMPSFTMEEIMAAKNKIRVFKAAGSDRIPSDAMGLAVQFAPEMVLRFMNGLRLDMGFLETWKLAKLMLLLKPGKEPDFR